MIGDEAPDFTLTDVEGREVSLSDFRGKVVLLDFWATWCAPCVQLMPFYQELQKEDHEFEFVVLTVNLESQAKARQFIEETGHDLNTVVDANKQVMARYGVRAIPDAILIDPDGIVRGRWIGRNWKLTVREALAQERVRQYMSQRVSSLN